MPWSTATPGVLLRRDDVASWPVAFWVTADSFVVVADRPHRIVGDGRRARLEIVDPVDPTMIDPNTPATIHTVHQIADGTERRALHVEVRGGWQHLLAYSLLDYARGRIGTVDVLTIDETLYDAATVTVTTGRWAPDVAGVTDLSELCTVNHGPNGFRRPHDLILTLRAADVGSPEHRILEALRDTALAAGRAGTVAWVDVDAFVRFAADLAPRRSTGWPRVFLDAGYPTAAAGVSYATAEDLDEACRHQFADVLTYTAVAKHPATSGSTLDHAVRNTHTPWNDPHNVFYEAAKHPAAWPSTLLTLVDTTDSHLVAGSAVGNPNFPIDVIAEFVAEFDPTDVAPLDKRLSMYATALSWRALPEAVFATVVERHRPGRCGPDCGRLAAPCHCGRSYHSITLNSEAPAIVLEAITELSPDGIVRDAAQRDRIRLG